MDGQGHDFFSKIDSDNDDFYSILTEFWNQKKRKTQILLIEKSWLPDPNIGLSLYLKIMIDFSIII